MVNIRSALTCGSEADSTATTGEAAALGTSVYGHQQSRGIRHAPTLPRGIRARSHPDPSVAGVRLELLRAAQADDVFRDGSHHIHLIRSGCTL